MFTLIVDSNIIIISLCPINKLYIATKAKECKEISKMNALKNDLVLHSFMKELDDLMREQKRLRNSINI